MTVRKRVETNSVPDGTIEQVPQLADSKTDHTRWRLKDDRGRQTWHYLQSDKELKEWPMTIADKYFLGLETVGNEEDFSPSLDVVSTDCIQRVYPNYRVRKHLYKHVKMASNSSPNSSSRLAIGGVNTADRCSCYQGSLLLCM